MEIISRTNRALRESLISGTNGIVFSIGHLAGGGGVGMIDWAGKELWSFQTNAPMGRPAVDDDGNTYFYAPNWVVHSVDRTGATRWTYPYSHGAVGFQFMPPVVARDGRVAAMGDSIGGLVVLDRDGNELWKDPGRATKAYQSGAVFAVNGDLLVCDKWSLSRYDETGEMKWILHLPKTAGSIKNSLFLNGLPIESADGTVFCRGANRVFAVSPTGQTQWNYVLNQSTNRNVVSILGTSWATINKAGDLVVIDGEFESLQGGPAGQFANLVQIERLVCLGKNGELKWTQSFPSSVKWSIPRSKWDIEVMWKSRMGRRFPKFVRIGAVASDGTVYVTGYEKGKTKIWAVKGD